MKSFFLRRSTTTPPSAGSGSGSASSPFAASTSSNIEQKRVVANSFDEYSSDRDPSQVWTQQENPLARGGGSKIPSFSGGSSSGLSRGPSLDRQTSLVFDNGTVLDEDEDDDAWFGEVGSLSPPSSTSFSNPRIAAGLNQENSRSSPRGAKESESSEVNRMSSSASFSSSEPLQPKNIRIAMPFVVAALLLQFLTCSFSIGAATLPPLPRAPHDANSSCSSKPAGNSASPLYKDPYVFLLLTEISNPLIFLLTALILISNPRGRFLFFECISVVLTTANILGLVCLSPLDLAPRLGYIVAFVCYLFLCLVGLRRRRIFSSKPDNELVTLVLERLPTCVMVLTIPLFMMASESFGCIIDNQNEPRLCEEKISSNSAVSTFIVFISVAGVYDLRLGENVVDIASLLRFDYDPFRTQVFVVMAFANCCIGLYIYASATVITCYEAYTSSGTFEVGSYASRKFIRYTFHATWIVLFALLVESKFIKRTTEVEKRVRKALLTINPAEYAPILRLFLMAAVCFLSSYGISFFSRTLSLRRKADPQEHDYLVFALNVQYTATKFTRFMIYLFGGLLFLAAPKRRHWMRFLWGFLIPIVHSLLVLVAVLLNPKSSAEQAGDRPRTLVEWSHEAFVSECMVGIPIFLLPTLNKSRSFLRLQSDAEIEVHFQRSLSIILTRLPPTIYMISEVYGCMVSSKSISTCAVLSDCDFAVAIYLALSSLFHLYLNHSQNHLEAENYLHFRGVDPYTAISYMWEGLACALAYCCFGLRPKNRSIDMDTLTSHDTLSERTGLQNGHPTVIKGTVTVYTGLIIFGYSIMLILGFFSLRNEEVKSRANLSGSVDVDEVQSSATARCCLALEKRVEETKKNVSVPEDEITISVVYKVALVVAIYCLSFTPVIGFILLGLQFLDPRLWKVGVGMIQLGTITNPIACISTATYIFVDLKRELSTRSLQFVIAVPVSSYALHSFIYLMLGEYQVALNYLVWSLIISTGLYTFVAKRRMMISMTTEVWRKQNVVRLVARFLVCLPTVVFLMNEHFSCVVLAAFNTPLLRDQRADPSDSILTNDVSRRCEVQEMSVLPMLWSSAYFTTMEATTFRQNRITTARLATLQLLPLDIVEITLNSSMCLFSIALFSFRNNSSLDSKSAATLFRLWAVLLLSSIVIMYMRDRSGLKGPTVQIVDAAERRPLKQLSSMGVSTRTKARKSVVQLGNDDRLRRASKSCETRPGGFAPDDLGHNIEMNPGLM